MYWGRPHKCMQPLLLYVSIVYVYTQVDVCMSDPND